MLIEQNARELLFKKSLDDFCSLLKRNQIRFLIFKGSAVAYDFYPTPVLRPRTDTDLLISESDEKPLRELLLKEGYRWIPNQKDLLGQTVFTKEIGHLRMIYDVHWELFAPYALRKLFLFEELWEHRKKISQLDAYTVNDQWALIISSVHWAAHHLLAPEPHWIQDTQRMALHRDSAWWEGVKQICREKGLQNMMHQTLIASQVSSPWTSEELSYHNEPLDYLLQQNRSAWTDLKQDLKQMSFQEIFGFLYRHAFPTSTYMRAKYKLQNKVYLPIYYVWRIFCGFKRFLQPW